jgi:SAM-dependent methyltransferase
MSVTIDSPSMDHLARHQRDVEEYKANVQASAKGRFGVSWWGLWDQHVHLPESGGTVVDLGCGPGTFLLGLRERAPQTRLIGVELHPALLELAREAAREADFEVVVGDLGLPVALPEASADVVVSSLVLHELPYPPDLLTNASRLLRPGGRLVLFDIVKWPLATYLEGRTLDRDSLDHFREHCLFTPEDLATLVSLAGLRVEEVVTRNNGRFAWLTAVKPTT